MGGPHSGIEEFEQAIAGLPVSIDLATARFLGVWECDGEWLAFGRWFVVFVCLDQVDWLGE